MIYSIVQALIIQSRIIRPSGAASLEPEWKLAMPDNCPECSAPVPTGGSCRDLFHNLLLLEAEVPGAPGSIIHFYTVATYVLQHPDSMNYTAQALNQLRKSHRDALDGRATVGDLRRGARREYDGPRRVTRRVGDPEVVWWRGGWPMTAADVLATATVDTYAETVLRWARSVRSTLDADCALELS
jgi:hypothetical protein